MWLTPRRGHGLGMPMSLIGWVDDRFLTVEDLMALVEDLGVGPVRDVGLLESAAARPRTSLWGGDAYPRLRLSLTLW